MASKKISKSNTTILILAIFGIALTIGAYFLFKPTKTTTTTTTSGGSGTSQGGIGGFINGLITSISDAVAKNKNDNNTSGNEGANDINFPGDVA